jgi:hypothetical protein
MEEDAPSLTAAHPDDSACHMLLDVSGESDGARGGATDSVYVEARERGLVSFAARPVRGAFACIVCFMGRRVRH